METTPRRPALLKHGDKEPDRGSPGSGTETEKAPDRTSGSRIRCPKCAWVPRKHDLWGCTICHHAWNTFDTFARCPSCGFQYEKTQCLRCHEMSPHRDWYVGEPRPL